MKGLVSLLYILGLIGTLKAFQGRHLPTGYELGDANNSQPILHLIKEILSGPLEGQSVTLLVPKEGIELNDWLTRLKSPLSIVRLPRERFDESLILSEDMNSTFYEHKDDIILSITDSTVVIAIITSSDVDWWPLWLSVRQWSRGAAVLITTTPCKTEAFMQVPFMQASWATLICPVVKKRGNRTRLIHHKVWTSFPFAAKNKSVALGVWNPERFSCWNDLFIDRFKDMREKRMSVYGNLLDVPILSADSNDSPPKGISFVIFDALSKWLGFSYDFKLNHDVTWTAIEGLILNGTNDLMLNFASITPQRNRDFALSIPYHYEGFGLILELPPPLPQWQNILYPFTWQVWTATSVSLLLTAAMFHLLNHHKETSFITNLITIGQGLIVNPPADVSSAWRIRFFLLPWWISAWILELSYICNLIAVLTIPVFPKKIQTAQELADSDYRLCMLNYGEFVIEALATSSHPTLSALGKKLDLSPINENLPNIGQEGCVELVLKGTHSHLETYSYINILYSRLGHNNRVYSLKEQLYPTYLCFPIRKDAPWKYKFDIGMQRLFESGLIQKWMKEAMEESMGGTKDILLTASATKSLSIIHLQGSFFILLIGHFLAFLVLAGEALIDYRREGLPNAK
ncbi:ionotropic receptor 21a-like [Palaemon carinicauda]|uniref:ionotropic receptor 21a-like n=1 Tax=Palaemon carinicauda TaxID=392227 RepID=UPI0035B5F0F3